MAEDMRGAGPSQSTVVHINRERGAPVPPPEADWQTGGVVPEAARRSPWGLISGLTISTAWLGAAGTWAFLSLGLDKVLALPPVEMAALAAAAVMPVSVVWLIVIALDRGAALRREADALRRQLALLAYPAEAAEGRISTIGDSLRAQVRDLSGVTRDAAAQGESLRHLLSRETRELGRLTEQIEGQTAHSLGRVAEEVNGLNALMERMHALSQDMDAALQRRQEGLSAASDRADRSAETLGKALAAQGLALDAAAEAVGRRCTEVEALVGRQEEGLARAEKVAAAFEAAAQQLDATTRDVTTGLARRAETIDTACRALAEQAALAAQALRTADDASSGANEAMERRAEVLAARNRDIAESARTAAQELDAATAAALGDFNTFRDTAHETIAGAKAAAAAIRDATSQGETVQVMLQAQAKDLEDAVKGLGAAVRAAGTEAREQGTGLEQVTERAGERIRHLADLLSRNAVDITRTTARSVVEIETVSEGLKAGIGQVEEVSAGFKAAAEGLTAQSKVVRQSLQAVADDLQANRVAVADAAESFVTGSDRLAAAANTALDSLSRLGSDLRDESDRLISAADGAVTRGRSLHETLVQVLSDYEDGLARSTDRLSSAGEQLRVSAETYEATAAHASERVNTASDELYGRVDVIQAAADKALASIDAVGTGMDGRATSLEMAGQKVADNLRRAAGDFARHTDALIAATRAASEKAQELETARSKVDLHRFLKQTSYAVERLQAAAVDITRLFSPSVEDDLWKRFYKGEQNVFLRQAARSVTRSQAASVRKLFAQNAEFRDYATRYMGEYEALMKAARVNDRADVLTAVFTASDMGRLYTVLAKCTGRTSAA